MKDRERHFTFPNVNFLLTICRTVYGQYKEYHNPLDNIEFADSNKILGLQIKFMNY